MAEPEELIGENVRHLRHVHFYMLSSCFVIIFAIYIALQDKRLDSAQSYLESFVELFGSEIVAQTIQDKIDLAVRDAYNFADPQAEDPQSSAQVADQVQTTPDQGPFVAWPSRDDESKVDVPSPLVTLLNKDNGLLQHTDFVDLILDSLVIRLHDQIPLVLSNSESKQSSDQCLGAILPRKPRKMRDLRDFWNSLENLNVLVVRQHLLYGDYLALLRFKPSKGSGLPIAVHVTHDVALKQLEPPLSMTFLKESAGIEPIDLQPCIGGRQEVVTRFGLTEASDVLANKHAFLYLRGEMALSSLTPGLTGIAV